MISKFFAKASGFLLIILLCSTAYAGIKVQCDYQCVYKAGSDSCEWVLTCRQTQTIDPKIQAEMNSPHDTVDGDAAEESEFELPIVDESLPRDHGSVISKTQATQIFR